MMVDRWEEVVWGNIDMAEEATSVEILAYVHSKDRPSRALASYREQLGVDLAPVVDDFCCYQREGELSAETSAEYISPEGGLCTPASFLEVAVVCKTAHSCHYRGRCRVTAHS